MAESRSTEASPSPFTRKQVKAGVKRLLGEEKSCSLGTLLGDFVLEPPNPFEAAPRRPKRWAAALVMLLAAALAIVCFFHLF